MDGKRRRESIALQHPERSETPFAIDHKTCYESERAQYEIAGEQPASQTDLLLSHEDYWTMLVPSCSGVREDC